jgi:hypothetical protein
MPGRAVSTARCSDARDGVTRSSASGQNEKLSRLFFKFQLHYIVTVVRWGTIGGVHPCVIVAQHRVGGGGVEVMCVRTL